MSVAFDTSLSGMRSTQTMLDVTANNLANATTFAFKASRVEFSDQIYENIQAAAGARSTTGGVNPMQVGLGVQVSAITPQLQQGGFEPTGRDLMPPSTGRPISVCRSRMAPRSTPGWAPSASTALPPARPPS